MRKIGKQETERERERDENNEYYEQIKLRNKWIYIAEEGREREYRYKKVIRKECRRKIMNIEREEER